MILHFTLSTSEIKEIKLVVRGISSFDYDALYNKLSINVEDFFIIDCMPDNLSWQDFNSSCNPNILIFYNVVEFHCDDTWCSIPDPNPFNWDDYCDYPDPDEAIQSPVDASELEVDPITGDIHFI